MQPALPMAQRKDVQPEWVITTFGTLVDGLKAATTSPDTSPIPLSSSQVPTSSVMGLSTMCDHYVDQVARFPVWASASMINLDRVPSSPWPKRHGRVPLQFPLWKLFA